MSFISGNWLFVLMTWYNTFSFIVWEAGPHMCPVMAAHFCVMVSVLAFEEVVALYKLYDVVFSVFEGVSLPLNDSRDERHKNGFQHFHSRLILQRYRHKSSHNSYNI